MPNSPIQVVLNSDNFLTAREAGGGGLRKEFYEQDPSGFSTHKATLKQSLTNLSASLDHNEYTEMGYAKVVLKRAGWAKSHRPTHSIFRPDIAPIVGAGGIGELYVEINKRSIQKIAEKIDKAEESLSYKTITIKDREVTKPKSCHRSIVHGDKMFETPPSTIATLGYDLFSTGSGIDACVGRTLFWAGLRLMIGGKCIFFTRG